MKAYIFPGQGAQFPGMAKTIFDESANAKRLMLEANDILGFDILKIMFEGTDEELKQTKVTQPAIFIHSCAAVASLENFSPDMVAGHSLGEFSALVANGTLTFGDGLQLVYKRALAMQKACELSESTMAAILGLDNTVVEEICSKYEGVVPANYNCPGQLVISGVTQQVEEAAKELKNAGAKRAVLLPVSGGFHSPSMEPARQELAEAIDKTTFSDPICPIFQNATASASTSTEIIRENLNIQLTAPVKWTQSVQQMLADGANNFIECGPGKVLQGLVKKIDRQAEVSGIA